MSESILPVTITTPNLSFSAQDIDEMGALLNLFRENRDLFAAPPRASVNTTLAAENEVSTLAAEYEEAMGKRYKHTGEGERIDGLRAWKAAQTPAAPIETAPIDSESDL